MSRGLMVLSKGKKTQNTVTIDVNNHKHDVFKTTVQITSLL